MMGTFFTEKTKRQEMYYAAEHFATLIMDTIENNL